MILLGLGSLFWVVPEKKSFSIEITARTQNPREKYLVTNFTIFVREVFTGITLILIGNLMEKGNWGLMIEKRNFLYVLIANIGLALLSGVLKTVFMRKERRLEEETSSGSD